MGIEMGGEGGGNKAGKGPWRANERKGSVKASEEVIFK